MSRLFISAGIVAPVVFAALVIWQGAIHDSYDHRSMAISALAAMPGGALQNLNFFLTGGLFVVFAYGLHGAIRPGFTGLLAAFLFAVSGAGVIVAGAIPMEFRDSVLFEPAGHVAGSIVAFLSGGAALLAFSFSRVARLRHPKITGVARLGGALTILGFVLAGALAIPPEGPLHANLGLVQRLVVFFWFGSLLVVGIGMLGRSRQSS